MSTCKALWITYSISFSSYYYERAAELPIEMEIFCFSGFYDNSYFFIQSLLSTSPVLSRCLSFVDIRVSRDISIILEYPSAIACALLNFLYTGKTNMFWSLLSDQKLATNWVYCFSNSAAFAICLQYCQKPNYICIPGFKSKKWKQTIFAKKNLIRSTGNMGIPKYPLNS